ncbi:potassium voltage-gated channel subfamily E member 4 [Erythrolamprus reginae]|uniref:potassium voltage-gated channel subfamily E member 4 n=1 Tax=Erythrolamprus reginae TaxID=121349 RepID=UPI00396C7FF4
MCCFLRDLGSTALFAGSRSSLLPKALMFAMDHPNTTQSLPAVGKFGSVAPLSEKNRGSGNEYFYILIVMTFYGIFLMGIMLFYMNSKRKEKKSNLLLLYKDEQRKWGQAVKPLPTISGLRSVQFPMISMLQDSMVPAFSCTLCSMEGNSETSLPDVHLTIEEEMPVDEPGESTEAALLKDSSEGSSESIHQHS